MKKFLKIIGSLVLLIIIGAGIFLAAFKVGTYDDFSVYTDLKKFALDSLTAARATPRPAEPFTLNLSFPYNRLFGNDVIGIALKSFETSKIAAASFSQFEVPPGSGYFRDFTFNIRPRYELKAPVFHIDFMKPSLGVPGLCSLDFFNADKEKISYETFFGPELANVKKALASVEKYQRTVEQGRGKITRYLDPYKSPFRLELQEPKGDEAARKAYYQAAGEAFKTMLTAYMKSLEAARPDSGYAERHEKTLKGMIVDLYVNDFAIKMGRKIFGDKFKKYWLEGFWNVQLNL